MGTLEIFTWHTPRIRQKVFNRCLHFFLSLQILDTTIRWANVRYRGFGLRLAGPRPIKNLLGWSRLRQDRTLHIMHIGVVGNERDGFFDLRYAGIKMAGTIAAKISASLRSAPFLQK